MQFLNCRRNRYDRFLRHRVLKSKPFFVILGKDTIFLLRTPDYSLNLCSTVNSLYVFVTVNYTRSNSTLRFPTYFFFPQYENMYYAGLKSESIFQCFLSKNCYPHFSPRICDSFVKNTFDLNPLKTFFFSQQYQWYDKHRF